MTHGAESGGEGLPVRGIRWAAVSAGLRRSGQPDLVVAAVHPGSGTAVTFTRNRFCAAPVSVAREHLNWGPPRLLLINAANANAGTGMAGIEDARACCRGLAEAAVGAGLGAIDERAVLPFSTGVIGQRLPVDKIQRVLPNALAELDEHGWGAAARGIMTTDTVPKVRSRRIVTAGGTVTVTGIAKGAGMICPDMATMLAFIATDAAIPADSSARMHRRLVDRTFNRISIDGDTSTNDAGVFIATGCGPSIEPDTEQWERLEAAILEVYRGLAHAIVRDGEGATKFVSISVCGGRNRTDCERVARTVAHSPLVKTALYAGDANWGRILAAVGRAGVELDIARVGLSINGVAVLTGGEPDATYTEEVGSRAMAETDIEIRVELGLGAAEYTLWTSDLSHDYVSINADYRS